MGITRVALIVRHRAFFRRGEEDFNRSFERAPQADGHQYRCEQGKQPGQEENGPGTFAEVGEAQLVEAEAENHRQTPGDDSETDPKIPSRSIADGRDAFPPGRRENGLGPVAFDAVYLEPVHDGLAAFAPKDHLEHDVILRFFLDHPVILTPDRARASD